MMSSLPEIYPNSTFSDFIPLNDVPRRIPLRNGKRLHISTVYRWTRGCKGICLEHWKIGRSIYTSDAALMKFFSELAHANFTHQRYQNSASARRCRRPRRKNDAERQRSLAEANAILVRAKIIPATPREAVHI